MKKRIVNRQSQREVKGMIQKNERRMSQRNMRIPVSSRRRVRCRLCMGMRFSRLARLRKSKRLFSNSRVHSIVGEKRITG